MSEYQACPTPYRPGLSDEDHRRHSAKANSYFYPVGLGFMRGIYTDEYTARQQLTRYSNGQWKKAATYDEAIRIWNVMCAQYHDHNEMLARCLQQQY
ncbi:hypothetical protein B0H14DRAFT_3448987 [Mycena olivaceomarginata]|nr:hypothetical protein B0H14DRAFT_3448987 [Mycena olivaceomarginata]